MAGWQLATPIAQTDEAHTMVRINEKVVLTVFTKVLTQVKIY